MGLFTVEKGISKEAGNGKGIFRLAIALAGISLRSAKAVGGPPYIYILYIFPTHMQETIGFLVFFWNYFIILCVTFAFVGLSRNHRFVLAFPHTLEFPIPPDT